MRSTSEERDFYRRMLERIRDASGRTCDAFETCTHAACASSAAAYLLAAEALSGAETILPPLPAEVPPDAAVDA
jgi:hypothetical protein